MLTKNNIYTSDTQYSSTVDVARKFMTSVFSWMFLALAVTAVTSYFFTTAIWSNATV